MVEEPFDHDTRAIWQEPIYHGTRANSPWYKSQFTMVQANLPLYEPIYHGTKAIWPWYKSHFIMVQEPFYQDTKALSRGRTDKPKQANQRVHTELQ
jgi:hypothetical protein